MDAGDMPGYRWVVQGQYEEIFRGLDPVQAALLPERLRPYLARVLEALALPDEGSYLDLGTGAGVAALAVARARPAMDVLGIDASEHGVDLARRAAQALGLPRARFETAHAEAPPPGPYDRMTSLSLFNLLPEKARALHAWRAALAPDGRLVLTDGFATTGPAGATSGALSDAAFDAMLRRTGWRVIHREDLTPLVRRLVQAKAWQWPEYVRPGYRYLLVALEPR